MAFLIVLCQLLLSLQLANADNAEIDRLVAQAAKGEIDFKQYEQEFTRIGDPACPRLIQHVLGKNTGNRQMALYALQFCWSEDARDALIKIIPDTDQESRRLAYHVLGRHETNEDIIAKVEHLTKSNNPEVSGPAVRLSIGHGNIRNKELIRTALKHPSTAEHVYPILPVYYGRDLSDMTLTLLSRAKAEDKPSIIVSLIHQHDDRSETRKAITGCLTDHSETVRDRAAEYLRWHGTSDDLNALRSALDREKDPYIASSMRAAVDAIKKRSKLFAEAGKFERPEISADKVETYRKSYKKLIDSPSEANRTSSILVLAGLEPFEPYWRFGITKATDDIRARITARLKLQLLASGYPIKGVSQIGGEEMDSAAVVEMPKELIADTLVGPVREYFDEDRKSYGLYTGNHNGPFDDSHHIGDDTAWKLDHESIVAIGDGIVRRVTIGQLSWGGLVIIEHQDSDGNAFCSLYAHLGPLIAVREGDHVKKGQKIGALGRSHTWEGGGYVSHIHFGIHKGPYEQEESWITGYLDPDDFKGDHGWVDPQQFIQMK